MRVESETTEVVQGKDRVLGSVLSFLSGAGSRIDFCTSYVGPRTGTELIAALKDARRRGIRTRLITEVTSGNLKTMKAASTYLEIRHFRGLGGGSWAVSDGEYISSLAAGEFKPSSPLARSNAPQLVAEHQSVFDALWDHGEPLEEREKSIEGGTDFAEAEIFRDPDKIKRLHLLLARKAEHQILLLLPTAAAFRREAEVGLLDILERKASKGVNVKVLTPVDPWALTRLPSPPSRPGKARFAFRAIPPADTNEAVTLIVVDHAASLTIDEAAPHEVDFSKAVGYAIVATREPRVRLGARFFERVWAESEMREVETLARQREEQSRKRAELMQDILTHDIRNFNQVARLNAELLSESMHDFESAKRVAAILRAVDGSTKLIERAKRLGSILTAGEVKLQPVSVRASFERAISLVRKGNPAVKIGVEAKLGGKVLADDLLDEVFVNILSNSVRYSDGGDVKIAVSQEPVELRSGPHGRVRPFWKVSVSDWGRGIPDSQKPSLFKRYLESAKGSGLGLSIVHALVTERYRGRAEVDDRVRGDFSQGTRVELWLPRALEGTRPLRPLVQSR